MEPYAFDTLIEAIGGTHDPNVIITALRNFAADCGFEWFTYLNTAGDDFQGFSNYPKEWQSHYLASSYSLIDPVIITARNENTPFSWEKGKFKGNLSKKQKIFFGEAEEFGIQSGLSIPIFTGFGRTAMLCLASRHSANDLPLVRNPAKATAAATYLHLYFQMVESGILASKQYNLTSRQLNCLKWAANNKTHVEIGQILGIGESAVRKHLDKAKEILGAGGIKNAIYIATKSCLI